MRIGTFLERIDPWRELAPLGHALALRRIHIYEVPSTSSRALREHLTELDLLVVVGGEGSDEAVSRLPVPGHTAVADLSRDVPWQELFSRDLAPLDTWYPDPTGVQSTFRLRRPDGPRA